VAQLVEQLIRNQQAAGSSPASSSKNTAMQRCNFVMQIAVFFVFFLSILGKQQQKQ
jgi:hypothetical protein